MKKLSMADNGFLQVERPSTPMHVAGVTLHKLPVGVNRQMFFLDLLHDLGHWLAHRPPFNQRLKFPVLNVGVPSLVADESLDLEYHMRHMALPEPGTMEQLWTLVAQLHGSLLDRSRPMWECRLIEGLEGGRFAIYFKVHHSCIDGMGAMALMKSMMHDDPAHLALSPPKVREKLPRTPASVMTRVNALSTLLRSQVHTGPELGLAFKDIALQLMGKDANAVPVWYTAPASPINAVLTAQRRFTVRSCALEDFRAIGRARGVTLNEVVMACCGGALRRYFLDLDKLPEQSLIACIPVSIRPKDGSGEGNAITSLLCSLGTQIEDPLERLAQVHRSSKGGKAQLNKMSKSTIEAYTLLLGLPFIAGQILNLGKVVPPPFNMVISNVPASEKKLYLCGAEMEGLYAVNLLFEKQALNITVTSYVDTLDFSFLACRTVIPELDRVADYLVESLEELCRAAGVRRSKSKKPRTKPLPKVTEKTKPKAKVKARVVP